MNTEIRDEDHAAAREILTVSQLNRAVAGLLERQVPMVRVEGELSNVVRAASGHWYFSLKDATAQVRCVMFRGRARHVDFVPREGDRVELLAVASLYEARGDFQLNVEAMRRAGAGDLYRRFLALKERLQREGLFDAARKRPLPAHPHSIGIVTSTRAAALRDVLTTLRRRAPGVRIVIYPTQVQGAEAPGQIVAALGQAGRRRECEVLLLVRGGGSIEDLWAFNDEQLARAIAACPVPVVAGVGHETDFTIADFVADLRAPTPTAAAELVAPDRRELARRAERLAHRLQHAIGAWLERAGQRLDTGVRLLRPPAEQWRERARRVAALAGRLAAAAQARQRERGGTIDRLAVRLRGPRADLAGQRLAALEQRLARACRNGLAVRGSRLEAAGAALALVSPLAVLERGYAIVTGPDGKVLRDVGAVQPGDPLGLRLASGRIEAEVRSAQREPGAAGEGSGPD